MRLISCRPRPAVSSRSSNLASQVIQLGSRPRRRASKRIISRANAWSSSTNGSTNGAAQLDFRNTWPLRPKPEGSCRMSPLDELFDDANGDLAIGELEAAVEKYRRCVELDPAFFDGWHALGMALMKTGRFPEAIEAGRKETAPRPKPHNPRARPSS